MNDRSEAQDRFEFEANMLAGEDLDEELESPFQQPPGTRARQVVLWLALCLIVIAAALAAWYFISLPDCEQFDVNWAPCFAPGVEAR